MALTVRQWRKAKEISQMKMADILQVHVNTYVNWENCPEKIPVGKALEMAQIFDVPIDNISFLSTTLQNVE